MKLILQISDVCGALSGLPQPSGYRTVSLADDYRDRSSFQLTRAGYALCAIANS